MADPDAAAGSDPPTDRPSPVVLPGSLLDRYRRFSLYNSPYAAHDEGRAIDLYPEPGTAPSPVSGEVLDVRSVSAPPKPYAEAEDHLILIAVEGGVDLPTPIREDAGTAGDPTARTADAEAPVARVLHVDPGVDPGDRVAVGDDLGRTIRSGFFAPWVGDHLHVGFRGPDANPYRASGSLPVAVDVAIDPLPWDGAGTVVERGDTYAVLDRPVHPAPGRGWAGIAAEGSGDGDGAGVLDGGLPHYGGGGILGGDPSRASVAASSTSETLAPSTAGTPVELLGTVVGTASGRTVEWTDRTVLANDRPITGLSLYVGRDRAGAKLVCPDADFPEGSEVRVRIE